MFHIGKYLKLATWKPMVIAIENEKIAQENIKKLQKFQIDCTLIAKEIQSKMDLKDFYLKDNAYEPSYEDEVQVTLEVHFKNIDDDDNFISKFEKFVEALSRRYTYKILPLYDEDKKEIFVEIIVLLQKHKSFDD